MSRCKHHSYDNPFISLTFPSSYHRIAWFRDKTLQSKIQLFVAGLLFATERPIFTGSVKGTLLSSKGWELGREVNTAIAISLISCCSFADWSVRELTTTAHEQFKRSGLQGFTVMWFKKLYPLPLPRQNNNKNEGLINTNRNKRKVTNK